MDPYLRTIAVNAAIKVTGAAAFARRLEKFSKDLGRSIESILKQEARACAVSLCFNTLPFGFGDPGAKQKVKIAGDIRKVYATTQQIYAVTELIKPRSQRLAMAFWHAAKKGDDARARKYLRQAGFSVETLDAALHRAVRTGPQGSVAKSTTPQQVVKDNSLARYTRDKIGTIGTAKAGWANAARGIGGRVRTNNVDAATGARSTSETIPAYIRKLERKYPGLGGARVMPRRIEIFTNVTYADEALPQGSFDAAITNARASFAAALDGSTAALRRKHLPGRAA